MKGETITITTDPSFKESCDEKTLYVDYENITKVLKENSKIYVDDGLISLLVKSVGEPRCDFVASSRHRSGSGPGVDTGVAGLPDL